MSKSKINISAKIFFNDRSVRASAHIVEVLGDNLVKLPRGFFPKRGAGDTVAQKILELVFAKPAHFSEASVEAFGASVAF